MVVVNGHEIATVRRENWLQDASGVDCWLEAAEFEVGNECIERLAESLGFEGVSNGKISYLEALEQEKDDIFKRWD